MSRCAEKILVDAIPCGCGPEAISLLSGEVGILIHGNHYTGKDGLFKCTVLCHHICVTKCTNTSVSTNYRRVLGTRLPGLDFILVCGWLLKDKLVCTCKTINLHFFVWLTATAWGLMCYHLQAVLCPHTLQLLWENMIGQLVTMHMHTATVYLYLMWHK